MSSFFDDLESQLRAAARKQVHSSPAPSRRSRGRRWLGAGARTVPVIVAVATTLAVVVIAFVLAGHGHRGGPPAPGSGLPSLNSPQTRQELAYIQAATAQTRRSPACAVRSPRQPVFIDGSPSPALTSILGVLRRPATPADRLSKREAEGLSEVYVVAVRRALVARGVAYYVVPSRQNPSAGQPSPRCFAVQVAALNHDLPKIPAALRAPTRALQARLIAYDRRLISRPPYDVICLATHSDNSGGESCGQTANQIEHGDPSLGEDGGTYSGIVPDGVASVTLRFPASGAQPAQSSTGHSVGNVFAVRAPPPAGGMHPQPTIILRSASGHILRIIPPPSGRTATRFCGLHPIECLAVGGGTQEQASSSSGTATAAAPPTKRGG